MPMTTLEQDTISKTFAVAKKLLLDLQPQLASLRELYDSAGGVKTTLTQEEMDEVPALSGLTKAQLDDALFAMTSGILPAIEAGFPALSQSAARFL